MLNLETICEMLEGAMTDAKVWAESGYIFIEQDGETSRLSIDRVRQ
jgi:transcriptional antiterminator Rof (Rho-off)